ncbi:MAG TPA: cupin domain-containing protein [Thermomicrobiaceae bacterium]|nr:cupin domain-containing protein [Thermomicrobiaceae bacterium]
MTDIVDSTGVEPLSVAEPTQSGSSTALGARLRSVRTRRGRSLVEVAGQAGVSKSLVSQIERGLAAPSLDTLRRLASALDVPVFSLFLDEIDNELVVRANRRRAVSYPGSKVRREILTPGLHGRMVLLWVSLPPHAASGAERVHHEGEECVVVISGTLTVLMGDTVVELGVGDSMTFDSGVPHSFQNPGDMACEAVVAISPPAI